MKQSQKPSLKIELTTAKVSNNRFANKQLAFKDVGSAFMKNEDEFGNNPKIEVPKDEQYLGKRTDPSCLSFESEIAAEDFHESNKRDSVRSSFSKVDTTRWDHEEADWHFDDFDDEASPASDGLTDHSLVFDPQARRSRLVGASPQRRTDEQTHRASHINSIYVKNFKKFRSFRVECGDTNILTGKNNAGKSTILDALRVAHDVLRVASRKRPDLAEFEGQGCAGFTLPTSAMSIPIGNITWNYSDEPAVIRLTLGNGSEFVILLQPDAPIKAFLLSGKQVPRTTASFRKQFPLSLVVVPTLGPVEENENYLTDKTISRSENTRTAHRHMRNILMRKSESEFNQFSDEVSSAWPDIELERPDVLGHDMPLEMMFLEDGIPRELFWSGFGLQVWMQMVLQFMRGSGTSVLVLDEPDIYLHPDLQKRMMRLVERNFGQIFVATHSPTIVDLANPDDVLTISSKEGSAMRGKYQ